MMYGTLENFNYFQCTYCECLQIDQIPENIEGYYPSDYYSYNTNTRKRNKFLQFLQKQRCRVVFFNQGYKLNSILKKFIKLPYEELEQCKLIIGQAKPKGFNCPILDIGSGSNSWWLNLLRDVGFTNLTGIDPYINKTTKERGILTIKSDLPVHNGQYEIITLHHSLEHMANQQSTFKHLRRLLADDGICIIRIPTVSSYAWKKYGVNWVELDPPRHFYLHSIYSLRSIAQKNGLELSKIQFDSTDFEFIGSEQYLKGIPLKAKNSYFSNPDKSIFSKEQLRGFKNQATKVNADNEGGRAVFFFRPKK